MLDRSPNFRRIDNQAFANVEVCWLPSMPLVNKRRVPAIAGLGLLYSEDLDQVFHVFETDNLKQSINGCSRHQAVALAQDPNCRISWYEIEKGDRRNNLIESIHLTIAQNHNTAVGA